MRSTDIWNELKPSWTHWAVVFLLGSLAVWGLILLTGCALTSVQAPAELRQKLLNISHQAPARTGLFGAFGFAANADSFIRRALPIAACLVVALAIGMYNRSHKLANLQADLFAHVYGETAYLASLNNGPTSVSMPEVNARMEEVVGAHLNLADDINKLEVSFAKDCWVAQQVAYHLIMRGKTGDISVMMIPDLELDGEFSIADDQYNGLITPTDGGYLVVIGSKQEPITEYRNLLSSNLAWEY